MLLLRLDGRAGISQRTVSRCTPPNMPEIAGLPLPRRGQARQRTQAPPPRIWQQIRRRHLRPPTGVSSGRATAQDRVAAAYVRKLRLGYPYMQPMKLAEQASIS